MMAWLDSCLSVSLYFLSFMLDFLFYIPYYFIQEPKRALEISSRQKAVSLNGHPAGPLRCAEEMELCNTPDDECATLDDLFQKAVLEHEDEQCLGSRRFVSGQKELDKNGIITWRKQELGEFEWMTYHEIGDLVTQVGKGLMAAGVTPQSNLALFAETRYEWIVIAQACFRENITLVTLYTTLGDEAIIHAVNQSEVTHVITSADLMPKLKSLLSRLPLVANVIYMKGNVLDNTEPEFLSIDAASDRVVKLSSFDKLVVKRTEELDVEKTTPDAHPQSVAVIMYTSGSSGTPKGVMLTHSNILAACAGVIARTNLRFGDTYIAYLPLSHILELVAEISCMYVGVRIGYATPTTLISGSAGLEDGYISDMEILQPTVLVTVPAILDKIYKKLLSRVKNGNTIYKILYNFALLYKRKWLYKGANTPLINATVMYSTRSLLGGNLRSVMSGGAPLNPNIQEFFRLTLSCPIIQGYGLTETCCAATITDSDDLSSGHVGAPLASTFIKLVNWEEGGYMVSDMPSPRGEVWVGGPSVALGYYKDVEKTDEDFQQRGHVRWFATGDIGRLRADGTLAIVDRKKDLIKLQTGEYISLGKVEAILKLSPLVNNACVIAKPDKYLVICLVVGEREQLQSLGHKLEVASDNWTAFCNHPLVEEIVLMNLQEHAAKNGLAPFEVPQKIKLVTEQWLPSNGMVTSSLKLKRRQLSLYYKDVVAELFEQARQKLS